jgi:hypothetical protein
VGTSTVFTNYIGRVLPSLGEDSVHLRALGERRGSARCYRLVGDALRAVGLHRRAVGITRVESAQDDDLPMSGRRVRVSR